MTSPTAETSPLFKAEAELKNAPDRMVTAAESDGKWLYRVGGICAFLFGIGYIVIIALYVPMGAPPNGAEAHLTYLARNTTAWCAILGLSVLTDVLLVPVALALFLALKGIHRDAMLLATACVLLFVILDLAITWMNYATLITLGEGYAAAADEAQRAVFVAAASHPSAVLDSALLGVYIITVPAVGFLITGLVMRKGIFNRITAWLGVITGILGILAMVDPFGLIIIFASTLTMAWILFTGFRLYKLGQSS